MLTFLGADLFSDLAADLFRSTGTAGWRKESFQTQLAAFVGTDAAKMIPVLEGVARIYGAEKVLDILEKADLDGLSDEDQSMIEGIKDALNLTVDAVDNVVGDGDDDSVWGQDVEDFKEDQSKVTNALYMVDRLVSFFGSTAEIRSFREAFFSVENAHLDLYDQVKGALRG
jgi:hypothetical protein